MTSRTTRIISISIFVILIAAWEIILRFRTDGFTTIPAPSGMLKYIYGAMMDGSLVEAMLVTLRRLFSGYAIGLGIGIPLGMMTARSKIVRHTLGVVALGLQTLPSVCWVPLALLWFGQTESAMLFIVVMGTVWAVIIATETGILHIPPIYREAAATMGSRGLHLWTHVLLPASLPNIVGGMKQGWAFAWRSLMAAEIYITILSGFGLGQLLHYGRELQQMEQVGAVMLIIVIIGFSADKILFSPWERFLRRRWGLHER